MVLLSAGFLLCQILLKNFPRVPFTSPYNPPAVWACVMWPLWLIGSSQFSYTLSFVETQLLGDVCGLVILMTGRALRFAVGTATQSRPANAGLRRRRGRRHGDARAVWRGACFVATHLKNDPTEDLGTWESELGD
jgi:hypothetical protein